MNFDEMATAVKDAERRASIYDGFCNQLVVLLTPRLRQCPAWRLKELKKELKSFNSVTGAWK